MLDIKKFHEVNKLDTCTKTSIQLEKNFAAMFYSMYHKGALHYVVRVANLVGSYDLNERKTEIVNLKEEKFDNDSENPIAM